MAPCKCCLGSGKVFKNIITDDISADRSLSKSLVWEPIDCPQCEGSGAVGLEQPNLPIDQCLTLNGLDIFPTSLLLSS